jgi:hypothetical protein
MERDQDVLVYGRTREDISVWNYQSPILFPTQTPLVFKKLSFFLHDT